MLESLFSDTPYVKHAKARSRTRGYTCFYLFLMPHGSISLWTSSWVCQEQGVGMMPCLWWWTDSPKWLISFHAARQQMLVMWQIYSSEKWSDFMGFQGPSFQTVIASFLLHFG